MLWGAVFATLYLVVAPVENANILFVTSFPSISHQKPFQVVWRELSLRGHNVTVICSHPLKDPTLTNLTEIQGASPSRPRDPISKFLATFLMQKPGAFKIFYKEIILGLIFSFSHATILELPDVHKLIKGDDKFDLVVVEWLFPTMAAFAVRFNSPLVGMTSLSAPIPALDTVGNPSHPVFAPDHNLPLKRDLSLKERIISTLYSVYVRWHYHWLVLPREDRTVKKYFGEDMPYIGDIERNISLLLLNRNPIFHRVVPFVPAVIELGSVQPQHKSQPLNEELKAFLDKSVNGVVYFSFGSNMLSEDQPEFVRNALIEAFSDIPYNVVWKWETDFLPGKPDNVFIQKWIPQISLLGHENVKVFITQGGLQSMEETISQHVPIIGVPSNADQTSNVDHAVKLGFGIEIAFEDISAARLKSAIHEIMENESYAKNVAQVDKWMKDLPMNPLDKAVWWIEYVIRNKGAKHLRSPSIDVPWYQYFLLDVIAIVGIVFVLLVSVTYFSVRKIFQLWKKRQIRKNGSSKTKKE